MRVSEGGRTVTSLGLRAGPPSGVRALRAAAPAVRANVGYSTMPLGEAPGSVLLTPSSSGFVRRRPAPTLESVRGRASRAAARAMPSFGGNRDPLHRTFPCEVRRSRGEPRWAWPSSSAHVDSQLLEASAGRDPAHPHGRSAALFAEQDETSGQDRLLLAGEGQEGLQERGVLAHALLHPPQASAVVEELPGRAGGPAFGDPCGHG